MNDIEALETVLGYSFTNKDYIIEALTHSSYSNEVRLKPNGSEVRCNERMEFFGDSVLSLVVSQYLFTNFTDMPEGDLSRIRAGAVCEKALGVYARSINLGEYLLLGHGEVTTNGKNRTSLLADAFEAVLAALYLDGGYDVVSRFLLPFVTAEIEQIIDSGTMRDYKTLLQQIIQQEHGEILEYVITKESGPAHKRQFEVEARLNSNVIGHGCGMSKRAAEQLAAKEALVLFGEK